MEKLNFDSGIKSYRVGSGVLRFNPSDPNVYARFLDAAQQLAALEGELTQTASDTGVVQKLRRADEQVKKLLGEVFGPGNDMDAIFSGISLLAVGDNGQLLLTNFMAAVEPILSAGIRRYAAAEAGKLA